MDRTTKEEGKLYITFAAYLDRLRAEENQKPPEARQHVPYINEMAEAIGVHEITLGKIINGKVTRLNLSIAQKILDYLRVNGFRPDVTDFIRYIPPE